MSTRQSDKRKRKPGGRPQRESTRRAVSATSGVLVAVGRVAMLAVIVAAVVQAVLFLVTAIVRPGSRGAAPALQTYVALTLAAIGLIIVLVIALDLTYLPDRLFARDRLGALFIAVWACGAVAIVVGLLGSYQLAVYVAIEILPGAVAFVLISLLTPGLYKRPLDGPGEAAPGDAAGSGSGSGAERGRQRRGGRARR